MTIGVPKSSSVSRPSVRWNGEAPPRIGTCCLAKSLRDTGQSREPGAAAEDRRNDPPGWRVAACAADAGQLGHDAILTLAARPRIEATGILHNSPKSSEIDRVITK